jgi:ubiquinone/menaquinone biosynthesis C-methylase UbiE
MIMSTPLITEYYNTSKVELDRLEQHVSQLEKLRSQEIISRYLKPNMKIGDIGGATGIYSFWLHDLGHEVHLLDAAESHIQIAQRIAKEQNKPLASIRVGDARILPYPEEQFDMVLLFGPLYHLQDKEDRVKAIGEAKRTLKPGGILLAATIGRYASLLDGFWYNFVNDPVFEKIMRRDLLDGNHYNPSGKLHYFTDAHFHTQKEIEEEFEVAAFAEVWIKAVEGFGWLIPGFAERWNDPEGREKLLTYIRQTESDPTMIGMSAHAITIAAK